MMKRKSAKGHGHRGSHSGHTAVDHHKKHDPDFVSSDDIGPDASSQLLVPKSHVLTRYGPEREKKVQEALAKCKQPDAIFEYVQSKFGDNKWVSAFDFASKLAEAMTDLSDYPCSPEEGKTLVHFCDMNGYRQMHAVNALTHAHQIWTMVGLNRGTWGPLLSVGGSKYTVYWKLMMDMNGDPLPGDSGCVDESESRWVAQMAKEYCQTRDPEKTAQLLSIAHWAFLCKKAAKGQLARELLVERMELESKFRYGFGRFVLLIVFFSLITGTIAVSGKIHECRSIRDAFISRFNLEELGDITSLGGVKDFLDDFSHRSGLMSPTSLQYYGEAQSIKILAEPEEFKEPKVLSQADLRMGKSFTIQAWVQIKDGTFIPEGGIPIFRRALKAVGDGSDLSCLSWNFPPSVSFGAHDYGLKAPNAITGRYEEFVMVNDTQSASTDPPAKGTYRDILMKGGMIREADHLEAQTLTMHTIVVNMTTVTFYRNAAEVLSVHGLDRMITDCGGAVSTVGDEGMYLATVLYLPRPLSHKEVDEIYQQGGLLGDTGYNIQPPTLPELTFLNQIANSIKENKLQADTAQLGQKMQTEAQNSLAVLAVRDPSVPQVPFSDRNLIPTAGTDPNVDNLPYKMILENAFVNKDSQIDINGDHLPKLTPTKGFSISVWLKFTQAGNGYLLSRAIPTWQNGEWQFTHVNDRCWSIYIAGGATEFVFRSSVDGELWGAGSSIADTKAPDDTQFRGRSWRHFFMSVDPTQPQGEQTTLCIDNNCSAYKIEHSSSRSSTGGPADCEYSSYTSQRFPDATQRADALANSTYYVFARPPGLWPLTGFVKNFKMYDQALTDTQRTNLYEKDPDPDKPGQKMAAIGCKNPRVLSDNPAFIDDFGHNCLWYYETRMQNLPNCQRNADAAKECPVACYSVEVCWGQSTVASSDIFNIWDQQMEIRSTGTWGTTCVAMSTTAEKEAIKCGLNAPNFSATCGLLGITQCAPVDCSAHEKDKEALINCLGDVTWTRDTTSDKPYRMMPCAEIVKTNVPSCAWDDSGLDDTAAMINSTGEFSIMFWFESILKDGCLMPRMHFIDGDGLTWGWLAGWEQIVLDPPLGDGCNPNTWYSFDMHATLADGYNTISGSDVEPDIRPKPGTKHNIIMGRQASPLKIALSVDTKTMKGGFDSSMTLPPLKANKDFLRVINIGGDVSISSIQITPKFPSPGSISMDNYRQKPAQALRRGADPTLTEQLENRIERDVDLFKQKMFLVAPPILVQARLKAADCNWDFSNEVVDKYYQISSRRHCEDPYSCQDYMQRNVYQCPAGEEDGIFFGLTSTDVQGRMAYAEFLTTLTQNPIVVRKLADGSRAVLNTDTFLDTLTDTLEVMSIFYSPEYEITTSLGIEFQFGEKGIKTGFKLQHYVALTGTNLTRFVVFQWVLLMIIELLLFIDLASTFKAILADKKLKKEWNKHSLIAFGIDFGIQILTIVFFILNQVAKGGSGGNTVKLLGNLVDMEWDNAGQGFAEKKASFLETFNNLDTEVQAAASVEQFGIITAFIVFLRVVAATSVHPRLALITSTLEAALSDMVHFFGVFLLVLWGFSVIGWWRFGRTRDDFQDIKVSMLTLIDAILGPPGALPMYDPDNTDLDYLIFALLTHLVNFFFLINFFLAIVVGAYAKVMDKVILSTVDQDAFSDTIAMLEVTVGRMRFKWPPQEKIIYDLKEALTGIEWVTPKDLLAHCKFPNRDSAETFYAHYVKYDFLHEIEHETSLEDLDTSLENIIAQLDKEEEDPAQAAATAEPKKSENFESV